jgi:hypothetical protein
MLLVNGLVAGLLAGVAAGLLMGFVSDVVYRCRIFRSSLLLIDGSFLIAFTKRPAPNSLLYLAGISIHLVTSAVFGAVYTLITGFLGLDPFSPGLVALYFFILWLSMLFIALPVAGQGVMGRKAHAATWFEQLILHVIFGAWYFVVLTALASQGIR